MKNIYILNKDHGKSAWELICEAAQSLERIKQRRHELWILSCYVDLNLIEEYVDCLLKSIRLTDVYFAFNFAEIYKDGPVGTQEKFRKIQNNLYKRGISFEWKALASSRLVHSKGYALIQRSDGAISGGVVLTTSANFTVPGFMGENIELGYLSTKLKDLRDFETAYNYLWDEIGSDINPAIFKQEEYLLKFALLSSGLFLHKWAGSLNQQIGIRYELTPLAKEKGTIAPELEAVGFKAGDTFTRQVLKLNELPKKEIPQSFVTRFTIETYWGRWCPRDAWDTLKKSFDGADQFIEQFKAATEQSVLQKIKDDALKIQNDLTHQGLIEPVKPEHLERWAIRIDELRSNHHRLERFYTGYEAHDLPYKIEQKSDVEDLFESLMEAIELSKAKNLAKEKVISARDHTNPELICLTDEEKQIIEAMRNDA